MNVETLKKLRALHGRLAFPKSARGDERRFLNDAFCVLARYAAAQGAHHKAGTMQASAPGAVFDVLKKTFGVEAELCASPVNCRFRNFGSALLDVDRHFGSFGSVFAFKPVTGSFQANPPFDSAFIGRLVKRFETLLRDTTSPVLRRRASSERHPRRLQPTSCFCRTKPARLSGRSRIRRFV